MKYAYSLCLTIKVTHTVHMHIRTYIRMWVLYRLAGIIGTDVGIMVRIMGLAVVGESARKKR